MDFLQEAIEIIFSLGIQGDGPGGGIVFQSQEHFLSCVGELHPSLGAGDGEAPIGGEGEGATPRGSVGDIPCDLCAALHPKGNVGHILEMGAFREMLVEGLDVGKVVDWAAAEPGEEIEGMAGQIVDGASVHPFLEIPVRASLMVVEGMHAIELDAQEFSQGALFHQP